MDPDPEHWLQDVSPTKRKEETLAPSLGGALGSGPEAASQEAAHGFSPRPEPEAGPPTPGVAISWSPGCRFLCTLPPRLPLPHLHSEATSCSEGWAKAVLKETGMWVESLGT